MPDLTGAVPPHEHAEDAFAFAGKVALSVIPVVGPVAVETLAHALDTRQAARQHQFNLLIAKELDMAIQRLDASLLIEDVVNSDEFISSVTRAQRIAAETTGGEKRRRLAAAVVNAGGWAPFSATERSRFPRLVEQFDDLHVWLLHFLQDTDRWLSAHHLPLPDHSIETAYDRVGDDGPEDNALTFALRAPIAAWWPAVQRALIELGREGLVDSEKFELPSTAPTTKVTAEGIRFLEFIHEPPAVDADPPIAL